MPQTGTETSQDQSSLAIFLEYLDLRFGVERVSNVSVVYEIKETGAVTLWDGMEGCIRVRIANEDILSGRLMGTRAAPIYSSLQDGKIPCFMCV